MMQHGAGRYRRGYLKHGADYWGSAPTSFVVRGIGKFPVAGKRFLDIGAGTGRNSFYCFECGANSGVSIDIDSAACAALLDTLVAKEQAEEISEGALAVHKIDCSEMVSMLAKFAPDSFDLIICYGLFHVLPDVPSIVSLLRECRSLLKAEGVLIVQSLTSKYPAPSFQPELESVFVTGEMILSSIEASGFRIIDFDDQDIVHSHIDSTTSEHRHGSVRLLALPA
jgi:SAM-dependent methyltransferase